MRPHDVVADRFEIEREAGSGGVGAVYRARDRATGGVVALKVLHPHAASAAPRFVREADVLASLRHPAIVRHIAHGVDDEGAPFLAMEWLEGETLRRRLKRAALTLGEAMRVVTEVADALGAVHRRGLVHRDVKPSNIFLVGGAVESPRVLDFGLVHGADAARFTEAGAAIGTPAYMSPEQARGRGAVDARADVFALGCVLYECLTGTRAFGGGDMMAVLAKVLLDDPPRLRAVRRDVGAGLDDLVARMLSKDPAGRPADGRVVFTELQQLDAQGAAPRRSTQAPALTGMERRAVSLVLARRHAGRREGSGLERHLGAHVGRVEPMLDGSLLFVAEPGGTPGDQAARAARAALSLSAAEDDLEVAVLTAWSVDHAGALLGDEIDRAVALLAADAEGVRLDDATAGLLGPRFEVKRDAHGARLVGGRDVVATRRTLLGNERSFVGRARELDLLLGLLDACVAEGSPVAAVVTGPPGAGKSRLRDELLRRAIQLEAPVHIWVGEGDPLGAGSAFGIAARLLRRAAGILEGEPAPVRQKKILGRVERHVRGPDQPRVAAFLSELVGAPFERGGPELEAARRDPMLMGDQLRAAFVTWLAAECAATPVLLVLEDLHWGDAPSVRLVDAALAEVRGPLMALATARPEIHALFPSLWEARGAQELRLGALPKRAAAALVREVLGDATPAPMVDRIVDLSAGNALYLEELIRAASEGRGDGAAPASVLAMVQTRLERLGDEARKLLRAASVFGEVFWRAGAVQLAFGVHRFARESEILDELARAETITRRAESRFPGEDEYAFCHTLVRDAAYATLPDADLELGHRLAAGWLEDAGECDALSLASHFRRGKVHGKAAAWYASAAEQALEGNDFEAAIERAELAKSCGASGDLRASALCVQAEASDWLGRHVDVERFAREAIDVATAGSRSAARARSELASGLGRLGRYDEIAKIGEELAREPIDGDAGPAVVSATLRCVGNLRLAGRAAEADRLIARVDAAPEAAFASSPQNRARLFVIRALKSHGDGDPAGNLAWLRQAIALLEGLGDTRQCCGLNVNAGGVLTELGAIEEAERTLRGALETSRRLHLRPQEATALSNLGRVLAMSGDLAAAVSTQREAIALYRAHGYTRGTSFGLIYLAQAHFARRELEDARAAAAEAIQLAVPGAPVSGVARGVAARVALAAGDHAAALEHARAGQELLAKLGAFEEGEPDVRLAHAEVLFATGDRAGAKRAIAEARARLRAMAARLTDPALAASYLGRPPANVRILALAEMWLGDAGAGPARVV